ncbi:hypothetical protein MJ904_27550 [Massilia sp. MB5]|uniref:hypothetical protein n=1 Tax=Massilia sp. MB5 TaxID=2919578 RepID=UPI001F1025F6|nr:hypothetical protein [Massilia sp. MB5]UMR30662.1 hypothetical protein MJ904_27550 [Massilia sp. MB5]
MREIEIIAQTGRFFITTPRKNPPTPFFAGQTAKIAYVRVRTEAPAAGMENNIISTLNRRPK